MSADELSAQVDDLLKCEPYAMPQAEKDARLFPVLRALAVRMAAACEPYGRYVQRLAAPPAQWRDATDILPLPVTMFKEFALAAVPPDQVVRELNSSATTGQTPSRIFVDKTTAFRQAKALAMVLKSHVGGRRRPFLVLDAEAATTGGATLTARGAAVRGIANFASEVCYAMTLRDDGDLALDVAAVDDFFRRYGADDVLLFGFTFIVWTRFVGELARLGRRYDAPRATLLHSGGWKKLQEQAVAKDEFTRAVRAALGCAEGAVLDFYGMVEQVGTVFVDCAAGHKHAPAFADVLIRSPLTLAPVNIGEEGIIEVLSVLPSSYPGHAIITEDQGALHGVDDCPCGRRGRYFRFTKRVHRAEVRGCGDTFARAREPRR